MVVVFHTPEMHRSNSYKISGDNIEELVEFSLLRIRERSKDYYRKHLLNDLISRGASLIDVHAGMGTHYTVELTGENGWRDKARNYLLAQDNINHNAAEEFILYNWSWLLSNEQNLTRFFRWEKVIFNVRNPDQYHNNLLNPEVVCTDPDTLQFCLKLSGHEFWYCEFDKTILTEIPNSAEHNWYRQYKGEPDRLLHDAMQNSGTMNFLNSRNLWISATIDTNDIDEKERFDLFSSYGIDPEEYTDDTNRYQMIAEMYFESNLFEFRKNSFR